MIIEILLNKSHVIYLTDDRLKKEMSEMWTCKCVQFISVKFFYYHAWQPQDSQLLSNHKVKNTKKREKKNAFSLQVSKQVWIWLLIWERLRIPGLGGQFKWC
jgi:hypothetical protein